MSSGATDAVPALAIRRLQPREWPAYRALRLRSLAEAPYAFGSDLATEEAWDHALWMARLTAAASSGRDCPLVAEAGGVMLGLVWAKCDAEDAGVVKVFQMWVAPEARGRGAARALLDAAVDWARSIGAHSVQLDVAIGNDAAAQLYRKAGFEDLGPPTPTRPGDARMQQLMHLRLGR